MKKALFVQNRLFGLSMKQPGPSVAKGSMLRKKLLLTNFSAGSALYGALVGTNFCASIVSSYRPLESRPVFYMNEEVNSRLFNAPVLLLCPTRDVSETGFVSHKKDTRWGSCRFMNYLPTEIQVEILVHVPISSYASLYEVFSQNLVDAALCSKLRRRRKRSRPLVDLVSTNLHELLGPLDTHHKNESTLALYYEYFDREHRCIWLLPDFVTSQYMFVVKDAYVSHGKLLLRSHDPRRANAPEKNLASLWDIRKCFPPIRAGTFSGATEPAQHQRLWHDMTLGQEGCFVDACLMVHAASVGATSATDNHNDNSETLNPPYACDLKLPRPKLPPVYTRKIPSPQRVTASTSMASYSVPPCGYFLVERVAVGISEFLALEPRLV